ncbi:hypothetical protein EV696_12221 [Permianibacter aggregans]|uniref:Uncharacterized protein n=1 Tax=Permianibacter aggregans TaxID=1510150 RepID=A0A4R6UIW1_9GAMM|nr:hypothetical protein EV696_12221 [Permianibacter aggregans]
MRSSPYRDYLEHAEDTIKRLMALIWEGGKRRDQKGEQRTHECVDVRWQPEQLEDKSPHWKPMKRHEAVDHIHHCRKKDCTVPHRGSADSTPPRN